MNAAFSIREPKFGFPKARRVRTRAEFLQVQSGPRVSARGFVVFVRARPDEEPARLGITVTRKFGGAVQRNRAKRLLREAFRLYPQLFPRGADLVVLVRPGSFPRTLAELRSEWQKVSGNLAARVVGLRRL